MSYYYESLDYDDYSYEYADNSSYGNNKYNMYELYSNHTKSDHGDPDPDPPELDNTNYDDTAPLEYDEYEDVVVNGEVYDLRELNNAINEKQEPSGYELEQKHLEYKPKGLEDEEE
jgi:hypothetical protein